MDQRIAELFATILRLGVTMGAQLIWAIIAALIMAAKGKSWIGGAMLGFFLGPFGVLITLFITPDKPRAQVYRPQPGTPVPPPPPAQMPATPPPPPPRYRFPSRCPNCNAPLRRETQQSPYTTCVYCGSQVEGTPE